MPPQKFIGVGEVLQSLGDHAGSVIVVFRFSLCSTWGMKYSSCTSSFLSQRQVLCYGFFFGRPGREACSIPAASVCDSKSPSCRWPLMKNVGVPLTPLLTPPEKSR